MKKTTKSILAKSLAFVMAFSLVGIASGVDAEAAAKPSVTKKVSVKVGKTKTVKVTSKKAVKKTTWTLNKAGKKVVTLSKKAKKSVTVKGKKAGKATLTAKVKVGSKTYKLTSKITVTKATNPSVDPSDETQKPDNSEPPVETPAPTEEPALQIGNTGKTYYESQNYSVDITELNETTFTCDSKRPEPMSERESAFYDKDGVHFTSLSDYNGGVSFYVNPCRDEKDIVDISATRGDGFTGFQNGTKDVSEYDYVRLVVTTNNELNFRTYNGNDQVESAGFPGSSSSETYEGGWIGPAEGYMESTGGKGMTVKEEYQTRTLFISMADLMAKGVNPANLTVIAVSPQDGGTEVTIHSIDFVKAIVDVPVTGIEVTAAKAGIDNGKSVNCTAAITPANASRTIVSWSSSDEKLATVNYNGRVTAAAEGTGKVTITATATDGSGVKGSVELTIGEEIAPPATDEPAPDVPIGPNDVVYENAATATVVNKAWGGAAGADLAAPITINPGDTVKAVFSAKDANGDKITDLDAQLEFCSTKQDGDAWNNRLPAVTGEDPAGSGNWKWVKTDGNAVELYNQFTEAVTVQSIFLQTANVSPTLGAEDNVIVTIDKIIVTPAAK